MFRKTQNQTQLPLNFLLNTEATFATFAVEEDNKQLVHTLQHILDPLLPSSLYLWGEKGLGKTHLLHSVCHWLEETEKTSIYLSLQEIKELSPDVFEGFEYYDVICLDDLQAIVNQAHWEEAVFHLFNRLQSAQAKLIVAANQSPALLPVGLPDLASRWMSGMVFQLHELNERDKKRVLQQRAQERGFLLKEEVLDYIMSHASRNLSELMQVLDTLDVASLTEKRLITIPFVKQVMQW